MIKEMLCCPRRFAVSAFRWQIMGAVVLTIGLGLYMLTAQLAAAGLPVPTSTMGPAGGPASVSSTEVLTLTILHTNDTWGYVDPCGWGTPVGGVARRATLIKTERAKQQPLLVLDTGNSLTGDRPPANATQGASSVEAMNMMGYDAMAIGSGDLKLGAAVVITRMHEAKFAFVSANTILSATGQLLAPAFITREIAGRRIAIVGLTGTWDPTPLPDVGVLDPVETAKKVIPEAQKQADIVILLSNAGSPTDLVIADEVPGISFIAAGGAFQTFGQSVRSPKTATLLGHADYPSSGHSGRTVGKAELSFDAQGKPISQSWQPISLGPDIADDPDMARWRAAH